MNRFLTFSIVLLAIVGCGQGGGTKTETIVREVTAPTEGAEAQGLTQEEVDSRVAQEIAAWKAEWAKERDEEREAAEVLRKAEAAEKAKEEAEAAREERLYILNVVKRIRPGQALSTVVGTYPEVGDVLAEARFYDVEGSGANVDESWLWSWSLPNTAWSTEPTDIYVRVVGGVVESVSWSTADGKDVTRLRSGSTGWTETVKEVD